MRLQGATHSEPYVNLSTHTAPIIPPVNRRLIPMTLVPFLVDGTRMPDDADPSLELAFRVVIITTGLQAARPLCRASVLSASWFEPLEPFPLHRDGRFPRSIQEPDTRSRRLYTGCRLVGREVSSSLIPGSRYIPGFDIVH